MVGRGGAHRGRWARLVAAGLLAVLPLGAPQAALAGDGDLDPTFGGDGIVTTAFPGGTVSATSVVVQADGKLVLAGSSSRGDFVLLRYTANGALDPSFGGDGVVTTDLGGCCEFANALVLQPDGKLVAAG